MRPFQAVEVFQAHLGWQADPTGAVLTVYLGLGPEVFLWLAFLNITLEVCMWGTPGPTPSVSAGHQEVQGGTHLGRG